MKTTHTPGPWTVNGREIDGPADSGVIVARLPEWGILADNPDPAPANARLITAAPEMLAALQLVLDRATMPAFIRDQVKATIARATYSPEV